MRKQAEACPVPPDLEGEDLNHTPFTCPTPLAVFSHALPHKFIWGWGCHFFLACARIQRIP